MAKLKEWLGYAFFGALLFGVPLILSAVAAQYFNSAIDPVIRDRILYGVLPAVCVWLILQNRIWNLELKVDRAEERLKGHWSHLKALEKKHGELAYDVLTNIPLRPLAKAINKGPDDA